MIKEVFGCMGDLYFLSDRTEGADRNVGRNKSAHSQSHVRLLVMQQRFCAKAKAARGRPKTLAQD